MSTTAQRKQLVETLESLSSSIQKVDKDLVKNRKIVDTMQQRLSLIQQADRMYFTVYTPPQVINFKIAAIDFFKWRLFVAIKNMNVKLNKQYTHYQYQTLYELFIKNSKSQLNFLSCNKELILILINDCLKEKKDLDDVALLQMSNLAIDKSDDESDDESNDEEITIYLGLGPSKKLKTNK